MKLGGQHAIHLHDKTGELHSFLPGDELPEWADARITNPHARSDSDTESDLAAVIVIGAGGEGGQATTDAPDGTLPKQTGPGASRVKWAAYAEANGVAVQEGWKREDIIAACEQAGVPVI